MDSKDREKILKAGKIVSQVRDYARTIIKPNVPLLEIAEKIESKIVELGGKPAFPCNLSINEIAAHYSPSHDDKTIAHGLIKVDFGVHVDGWTADNSLSFDLENSEENKKLITAAEKALDNAIELIKKRGDKLKLNEIGAVISETVGSRDFNPIINLCGHSMKQYELHGGITIPNIDDGRELQLKDGLYAIEPFATLGSGKVRDGRPSGIYELKDTKKPRSELARQTLAFIEKEYNTLPFCSRWLVKKLGLNSTLALRELEANGNLHHFKQLVEVSDSKVSQAEHTILVEKGKVTVTTP